MQIFVVPHLGFISKKIYVPFIQEYGFRASLVREAGGDVWPWTDNEFGLRLGFNSHRRAFIGKVVGKNTREQQQYLDGRLDLLRFLEHALFDRCTHPRGLSGFPLGGRVFLEPSGVFRKEEFDHRRGALLATWHLESPQIWKSLIEVERMRSQRVFAQQSWAL